MVTSKQKPKFQFLAFTGAVCVSLLCAADQRIPTDKPNLILVLLDDVSAHGGRGINTPNLDRIA